MYYILVYDISKKRVNKVHKTLKKYLTWVQNSVFEGELSQSQYKEMINEVGSIIKIEEDSIIIYSSYNEKGLKRKIIGIEKNEVSDFI